MQIQKNPSKIQIKTPMMIYESTIMIYESTLVTIAN